MKKFNLSHSLLHTVATDMSVKFNKKLSLCSQKDQEARE